MRIQTVMMILLFNTILFAKPGDLDPSFGNDGIVITEVLIGQNQVRGVAIQNDGKIVAAGSSDSSGSNTDFTLVRYDTNGSLDTSFDDDGIVTTDIGSDYDTAFSTAIQSDGKIVEAGRMWNGSQHVFALTRHDTNGSLDTSFDGDGIVTTVVGSVEDSILSIAIQSDSKIVVAGYSKDSSYDSTFVLARYDTNGSLDTSFHSDGIVTTDIGSIDDSAQSVSIQSDGKIVAAGYSDDGSNYVFAVVRYNTDGSLDTSFDSDGIVTTVVGTSSAYARSIAIQNDGKIVAAGSGYLDNKNQFALVRYDTNGSLDTSFDDDGIVTTVVSSNRGQANSVAIQSNGKLVAAGPSYNGSNDDFTLVRYNRNGSLDTNFGTDGIVTTAIRDNADTPYSVAIQSDGKIIAAGTTYDSDKHDFDFTLIRYEGDPIVLAPIYYLLQ